MTRTLHLVAVGHHVEQARAVARSLRGTAFVDERAGAQDLPFRAMVVAVTDDLESFSRAAGVGAYVVCRRIVKARGPRESARDVLESAVPVEPEVAGIDGESSARDARDVRDARDGPEESAAGSGAFTPGARLPGVIGLFPMVRHPDRSHRDADRHWRDVHAPLALEHHAAMSHYTQLSVVHRLHGPEWDGFALCGFDSMEDLKERFFATPEGRIAIRDDVARFADTRSSPRRLIVVEESYGG